MSKLYIFGIGGTGSRVIRSFTMLLAAGVKINIDEIIPIIIDPDKSNADLTRTVSLLNNYRSIRSYLTFDNANKNEFFKKELSCIIPNYTMKIKDTEDRSFREFIGYSSMSDANRAMTKMLFSEKNLQSSMGVGFKGNPNIGSVVLNQLPYSDDFTSFANNFEQGDKIFIISSIFGGTGASGFPLLLKTLRHGDSFPNYNLINNSEIGALTMLPYFKVEQSEESEIDSSTFISKTKSALAYYENNIIGNNSVNALYYLSDDTSNTYENHEGGNDQQNDAHLIEFLGATAIFDFCNANDTLQTVNKELGMRDLQGSVTFNSFYDQMRRQYYSPLAQFILMANALVDKINYLSSSSFAANEKHFKGLYDTTFFKDLESFLNKYREWLGEMKRNKRSLDLFNLDCGGKPFNVVTGIKPKKVNSFKSDYDLVYDRLNDSIRKCKSNEMENKFLEMYFIGTQKLVSEKLS